MEPIALTVGSLFTGIGGFDLGFERAGFEIKWMCEIDPFCRRVLKKHWPKVPIYEDVRILSKGNAVAPQVLIGGFPCQDISTAGKRVGINGSRSGLWWQMFRIICEFRPQYVAIENVSALLAVGNLDTILGAFASIGYDAEWETLSAAAFGAPHIRERVFIVAYPYSIRRQGASFRPTASRFIKRLLAKTSWVSELPTSAICRVGDGVPQRVDRVKALGNAVIPQVAEYVAHCIQRHAQAILDAPEH